MCAMTLQDGDWQVQKICTDVGEYELNVEKQKIESDCDQKRESWKWMVSYQGAIVASGSVNSVEDAKKSAMANVPDSASEADDPSCGECND